MSLVKPTQTMENSSVVSRKRPRPGSGGGGRLPDERKDNSNNKDDDNEVEKVSVLTPHARRLLKLIEEGSEPQHAKMAASQLTAMAATCAPVVLWDILGRLQGFLVQSDWKARQNASWAMQGVATCLPKPDQCAFFQHQLQLPVKQEPSSPNNNDDKEATKPPPSEKLFWLTVQDLDEQLDVVLERGRRLWASSSTRYEHDAEERKLQALGSAKDRQLYLEHRVRYQREVLARRLGLAGVMKATKCRSSSNSTHKEHDILPSILGPEDLMEKTTTTTTKPALVNRATRKESTSKKNNGDNDDDNDQKCIRALLVMEMKTQQDKDGVSASHRNPQTLLTTDLLYRVFDADWYVRHGALLGLLALLQAWTATTTTTTGGFGPWPQDILARALCVLALDRLGDFGDDGNVTAPVRDTAAQVVALLYRVAPTQSQQQCRVILQRLLLTNQSHQTNDDEWEPRHGAIMAMQYLMALHQPKEEILCTNMAMQALQDPNLDVQAVAAKTLLLMLSGKEGNTMQLNLPQCAQHLWKSLSVGGVQLLVSSANQVELFSHLVCRDPNAVLKALNLGTAPILDMMRHVLIDSDAAVVVRLATLGAIRTMLQSTPLVTVQEEQSLASVAACIFDTYWTKNAQADDNGPRSLALRTARNEAWDAVTAFARERLTRQARRGILVDLLLRFLGLSDTTMMVGTRRRLLVDSSSCCDSSRAADALAAMSSMHDQDVWESVLGSLLATPWSDHCVAACLLIRSILKRSIEPVWLETLIGTVRRHLEELPLCVTISKEVLQGTVEELRQVFDKTLAKTLRDLIGGENASGSTSSLASQWLAVRTPSPKSGAKGTQSVEGMRVMATVAGCVVAAGPKHRPAKVTPLIRALMTSIKSEADVGYRTLVAEDLCSLLQSMSSCNQKPRDKIVENVCKLVVAGKAPSCQSASNVLSEFIQGSVTHLSSVAPLVSVLTPLSSSDPASFGERLNDALILLHVICKSIHRKHPIASQLIDAVMRTLVPIGCLSADDRQRKLSIDSLIALCKADPPHGLRTVLPVLVRHLEDVTNGVARLGASQLLHGILLGVDLDVVPFVKPLLPIVMSMMTDQVSDCAKQASHSFAILVRMAPLVRESDPLEVGRYSTDAQGVVDHLIHGKALDPVILPKPIEDDLHKSGIKLRAYQHEGVAWLKFLQSVRLNGALCDEMGLGKTLQALLAVALAHEDQLQTKPNSFPRSLVVCPSTLVGHWVKEAEKLFPRQGVIKVGAFVGKSKNRQRIWDEKLKDCTLVVTSYSVLRSSTGCLKAPLWTYCILDEGHLLKNPETVTARAARQLQSRHRLILTGTPVQNHVNELWATFDFLMPNFLGSKAHFTKQFAKPICRGQDLSASAESISKGMEKLKTLHQQVLPFILRREKQQVLKDLPPKCVSDIPCPLTEEQEQLYTALCRKTSIKESLASLSTATASRNSTTDRNATSLGANVFKSLLYLRLLCTHPKLVTTRSCNASDASELKRSGKLVALNDLLRSAGVYPEERTAADGDVSLFYVPQPEETEKSDVPTELLKVEDEPGLHASTIGQTKPAAKCLIFAQFKQSLDVVEKYLFQPHMPSLRYLRLDGSVPPEKRPELVDRFNNDVSINAMLLTTRVGGLGLNLTGASVVVFLEHDFNPHADLQAMDRAHRIGQAKTVNVYRLVTTGTVEEKVMALQKAKMEMSDAVVNTENSSLFSMGTDRLLDIFTFRSDESSPKTKQALSSADDFDAIDRIYDSEYASLSVEDFTKRFRR